MRATVSLYSNTNKEIEKFLNLFFDNDTYEIKNELEWSKEYQNPIEMSDIIGSFIDNNDKFNINMWISIDEGIFINITDSNADKVIKYLYERFPY